MKTDSQIITQRKQNIPEDVSNNKPLVPAHTRQAAKAMALLLFFSCLMFTVPFGVFYLTRHFIELHLHLTQFETNAWSVLASVISVNIIIAMYVFIAYHDPEYDEEGNLIIEDKMINKSSLELKQD